MFNKLTETGESDKVTIVCKNTLFCDSLLLSGRTSFVRLLTYSGLSVSEEREFQERCFRKVAVSAFAEKGAIPALYS